MKNNAIGNYEKMNSSWKKIIHFDLEGHYLCNRKCKTFPQKRTKIIGNVTCRCCLSRLRKNKEQSKQIVKREDFEIKEIPELVRNNAQGPKGWNNKKKMKLRKIIDSIKLK